MWISSRSSRAISSATSRPVGRSAIMALVLCSLPVLSFAAPAEEAPVVPTTASEGLTAQTLDLPKNEQIELSLDQALFYSLRHNVSLVVQRYEHSRVLLDIDVERGIFDFNLEADTRIDSRTRPRISALEDAGDEDAISTDTETLDFRVRRNLPWGGNFLVGFENLRQESSNQNVQPNPQYTVDLNFLYVQPLLRDFGRETTEQRIWIASNNARLDREAFRRDVEDIIQRVTNAYWNLVGAREQLTVSLESLQLAKELHEMNRIQVDVGTKAPLELVQSEVGVAIREEEILRRRVAVEDNEDILRGLMNLAQTELWSIPIVPITEAEIPHQPIDLEEAVAMARQKRVDILQQKLVNEQRDYDLRVAANQTKPRLDLQASYGYAAVDGTVVDIVDGQPVITRNGYGDALSQITGLDNDAWALQLNFAISLKNTTARARLAQAEIQVDKGELELRDLMDVAMLEVRRAARQVEAAAKGIELARVSGTLARRNLEAEQKRYENGLSTSFQVLEIQEDLSIALFNEVNAVITYRQALVDLDRATGELLEKTGVRLAGDEDPEY